MKTLVWSIAAVLTAGFGAAVTEAQTASGPEYGSYLAHVAAANASLRLHETAEAKRWLAGR